MRRGRLYLDDPDDLADHSNGFFWLVEGLHYLDFARRYYKRRFDLKSKEREKEIRKLLNKISEMQGEAIRAFSTYELEDAFTVIKSKIRRRVMQNSGE